MPKDAWAIKSGFARRRSSSSDERMVSGVDFEVEPVSTLVAQNGAMRCTSSDWHKILLVHAYLSWVAKVAAG